MVVIHFQTWPKSTLEKGHCLYISCQKCSFPIHRVQMQVLLAFFQIQFIYVWFFGSVIYNTLLLITSYQPSTQCPLTFHFRIYFRDHCMYICFVYINGFYQHVLSIKAHSLFVFIYFFLILWPHPGHWEVPGLVQHCLVGHLIWMYLIVC